MEEQTTEQRIIKHNYLEIETNILNRFAGYALQTIYLDSLNQNSLKELISEKIASGGGHLPIISNNVTRNLGICERTDSQKAKSIFQSAYNASEDKTKFLRDIILQSDVSCACKLYIFMPNTQRGIIDKRFQISDSDDAHIKELMNELLNMRNKYVGHVSANKELSDINKENINLTLDYIRQLLDKFIPQTKNEQSSYENILDLINLYQKKINAMPCTLSSIKCLLDKEIRDASRLADPLIISHFGNYSPEDDFYYNYDKETKQFYFITRDEIIEFADHLNKNASCSSELKAEDLLEKDNADGIANFNQSSFSPLNSLIQGINIYPTESQLSEIFNSVDVFMVDTSFLLNPKKVYYFRDYIAPELKRRKKLAILTWPTRVELFMLEKREVSKKQRNAKDAHRQYHLMHNLGCIQYGNVINVFESAEKDFMHTFSQNRNTRFAIFTQDPDLMTDIQNSNLCNVLPITVTYCGTSVVFVSNFLDIVKRFAAGNLQEPKMNNHIQNETISITRTDNMSTTQIRQVSSIPKKVINRARVNAHSESSGKNNTAESKTKFYKEDGSIVSLGKQLGIGGEGTVYELSTSLAVKIYHQQMCDDKRYQKVRAMVSANPGIKEICWPIDMIYSEGHQFVGFTMPKINGNEYKTLNETVLQLSKESVRKKLMPKWDRLSLVKTCIAILNMFKQMKKHHIIMGDINPNNILVTYKNADNPKVAAVDADSMQFAGFPCPVGVKDYTSPEIYKRLHTENPEFGKFLRTDEDEQYALANLLFRILMLNISPYNAKDVGSQDEARKNYNFSYRSESNTGADTPDGPYRMIWNNTLSAVKENFTNVFAHTGKSVDTESWLEAFNTYQYSIEKDWYTKDLLPNMYYDKDTPDENGETEWFKYFNCESCGKPTNLPKKNYEDNEKYHFPELCPACRAQLFATRGTDLQTVICDKCGEPMMADKYRRMLHDNEKQNTGYTHYYPYICPRCKEERANSKSKYMKKYRSGGVRNG